MGKRAVHIDTRKKIVTKKYNNEKEAEKYFLLYSKFYHHARPIAIDGSSLIYHYAEGIELRSLLLEPGTNLIKKSIISLAQSLSKNHLNYAVSPGIYSHICSKRRPMEKHDFIRSGYYTGTIHGDLNTRNIIVAKDGKITFIDRLSEDGDIMYDFTFIMSILCFYIKTQNKEYLKLLDLFWKNYNILLKSKDDFFISFRNNFINYGNLVAEDTLNHSAFPEWRYGHLVSEEIEKHSTLSEFLH